jgi:WD40 repeat protein
LAQTLAGHESYVYDLAYSPDGKYLVSASRDQAVRLWDMTQSPPQTVGILYGHNGLVRAVAYRPDGKVFVSGGADMMIRRFPAAYEDVLRVSKEYVPRELTSEERQALLGE